MMVVDVMASCVTCTGVAEILLNKENTTNIIMISHNHDCEKINIIITIMRNTSRLFS